MTHMVFVLYPHILPLFGGPGERHNVPSPAYLFGGLHGILEEVRPQVTERFAGWQEMERWCLVWFLKAANYLHFYFRHSKKGPKGSACHVPLRVVRPPFTGLFMQNALVKNLELVLRDFKEVLQNKQHLHLSVYLAISSSFVLNSSFLLHFTRESNYGSENIFKNVKWIQHLLYSSPVK